MALDVGIVIVTYNSADVIEGLLASIPPATEGLASAVVVVDNGSTDGTADLVDAHAGVQVVRSTNRGYSAGINRGVEALTDCRSYLILNPDARLEPHCVSQLIAALAEPGVGIAVPQIHDEDGHRSDSLRRSPSLGRASGLGFTRLAAFSEYVTDGPAYAVSHDVDWATGAVMLVAAEVHEALGGWDESYFLYSEETDFCLRAKDRGWATRYVPGAGAMHIGGGSGRTGHTHSMQIVNRVRLYVRRSGVLLGWVYFWLTVLSETSWILRGHRESRASVRALLRPSSRPPELNCSEGLLPR